MWVLVGSFFTFSNFYRLDSHNKTHVAIANLWRNICQSRIGNNTSLHSIMLIISACMFISFLIGYISPLQLCSLLSVEYVVVNIWRRTPISFKHVSLFMMFSLWSSPNHIPIKHRGPIKQTSHLRPISLYIIPSPHLLVLATNERFPPARGTFIKSYFSQWEPPEWLQPVLVLSVHWWPAWAGVGRV